MEKVSNNTPKENTGAAYRWDAEVIKLANEVGKLLKEQEKELNARRESSRD